MHLKRYRMPTVREALARVREDLGPDALVLSTKLVPKRGMAGWLGGREVEITAAADRPGMSESRPPAEPRRQAAPVVDNEIVARLLATGLDARLARQVADAVPRQGRRAPSVPTLRKALATCLEPMAAGEESFAPVEVFVGPPGAGKTTTIAKIAAQERARRGRRLGLVAADGYRVGAVEQLRLYADIIGSTFTVARTRADIESALATRHPFPVLVDTAGRSSKDRAARELFDLVTGRPNVRTHLVIPAATPEAVLDKMLSGFRESPPDRVVLTRLDEIDSITSVVSALRERRLSISYLGTGQRVPEDLERATPPVLAARLLGDDPAPEGARA